MRDLVSVKFLVLASRSVHTLAKKDNNKIWDKKMDVNKSIFMSHSSKDKQFARKLTNDILLFDIKVWSDEAEMGLGDSILEKIKDGVISAECLAVILSPDSVNSIWVSEELNLAKTQQVNNREIKILPLLYRDCDISKLTDKVVYADFT